jgi:hypothetical protein
VWEIPISWAELQGEKTKTKKKKMHKRREDEIAGDLALCIDLLS